MKHIILFTGITVGISTMLFAYLAPPVQAHCQIPCGIYDDQLRINLLKEDVTTIEKSMKEIQRLSNEKGKNFNQIVRWVNNKEEHAEKISKIVTYYFMAQRVKPVSPKNTAAFKKYMQKLRTLHSILFFAMKAKQSTELEVIVHLKDSIEKFEHLYLKEHEHHR